MLLNRLATEEYFKRLLYLHLENLFTFILVFPLVLFYFMVHRNCISNLQYWMQSIQ
jgi:hypothetical protein